MPREWKKACSFLMQNFNVVVPKEVAVNLTDTAVRLAFEAQGRSLPPDLLVQLGGGGSMAGAQWDDGGVAFADATLGPQQQEEEKQEQQQQEEEEQQQQQEQEEQQQQHWEQQQQQQQRQPLAAAAEASAGGSKPQPLLQRVRMQGSVQLLLLGGVAGALLALVIQSFRRTHHPLR